MSAVRVGSTTDKPAPFLPMAGKRTGMQVPRGKVEPTVSEGRRRHGVPMTLRLQKSPTRLWRGKTLLAEAQPLHHVLVAIGIVSLEVVQQASPLADQHEKTAARAMIFLVCFEVLRQLTDPLT